MRCVVVLSLLYFHDMIGDARSDSEFMEAFSSYIGRPVRVPSEIKTLGFYAKRVRARIEAERKAALENLK